jgi:hypothetical protein
MTATGGSIESITIKGRTFDVDGESTPGRKLGGKTNEVKPNGSGSARVIQKRNSWMISDAAIGIDDDNGDQEFLQDIADSGGFVPCTITYASGKVYQGQGQIVGDIELDPGEQTCPISLSGKGKLTPQ